MRGMSPTVAVIIPTLNEATTLHATLQSVRTLGFTECLVVDGGSTDGTPEIVRELSHAASGDCMSPLRLLTCIPGRAQQMNLGAEQSAAQILLFLHADTRLPSDALQAIVSAISDPACVGGRFDVQFDRRTGWSRLIAAFMNRRSRWTGMMTGDQAMFVRAGIFRQLGGFAPIPLMEDLELSRRLKRKGTIAALHTSVTTSYRRWEQEGPIRTILRMWTLRLLYWLGVSPGTLVRYYRFVR
ncbi:glycosyl transferase family 2 [Nitrospira sp.]|nr:glycosyl transferase family 2 [Nitrospira sp.]